MLAPKRLIVATLLVVLGASHAEQRCDTRSQALSSPSTRFHDHADGTVSDRQSRLMWLRCSVGQRWTGGHCDGVASQLDWQDAQREVQATNQQGEFFYNDWRLPQAQELAMITERQCENPRINLDVFPDTPAAFYWTATPRRGQDAEQATFALSFGAEGIRYEPRSERFHVRLVRHAR